jgi:hypothetical protein
MSKNQKIAFIILFPLLTAFYILAPPVRQSSGYMAGHYSSVTRPSCRARMVVYDPISTVGGKNRERISVPIVYIQSTQPTNACPGDIWVTP